MMNPVLSQLNVPDPQVELTRWGEVRVTVTIQLLAPLTLIVVL